MKKIIYLLVVCCISSTVFSQSLLGAWEATRTAADGKEVRCVVIFADGYQVATWHDAKTGKFIATNGGKWSLNEDALTEVVEFDSSTPDRVGSEVNVKIKLTKNTLSIVGKPTVFKRIDAGTPGKLQGAWLMSGRIRNGKTQARDVSRPRKTMKILSGTRFQWIAYNTETKEFKGSGGGTYTTVNGKYTENIEFFSRDDSRVGASLKFDFSFKDGSWHHQGFSSKGAAMHEIWSVRK